MPTIAGRLSAVPLCCFKVDVRKQASNQRKTVYRGLRAHQFCQYLFIFSCYRRSLQQINILLISGGEDSSSCSANETGSRVPDH